MLACLFGQGVTKVEVLRDLADVGTRVWEMGAAAQSCTMWFLQRTSYRYVTFVLIYTGV